jgi:hypothetical protein
MNQTPSLSSSRPVTFMNPAAERLTGFKFSEISKRKLPDSDHSLLADVAPHQSPFTRPCTPFTLTALPTPSMNVQYMAIKRRMKPSKMLKYSVAPLRGGYEHGAVIEFRDISEEKQLEHERMEARLQTEQQTERVKQEEKHRKQMGEFIDYVCHEVRNVSTRKCIVTLARTLRICLSSLSMV